MSLIEIRNKLVEDHCEGVLDETGDCHVCNAIIALSEAIGDFW
jgi:hypothetical protein